MDTILIHDNQWVPKTEIKVSLLLKCFPYLYCRLKLLDNPIFQEEVQLLGSKLGGWSSSPGFAVNQPCNSG